MNDREDEAPGWDAISVVFTGCYGKEVLHYGTLISARLGGDVRRKGD